MIYSCAYFKRHGADIDEAQRDKLTYICRKLRLQPGEKLLDLGCGWGGLVIWAAKHFSVEALGITLSSNQFEYAQERIKREGIGHLCRVELRDYREIKGEGIFDKVVSIGMFEHVGLNNLPVYFGAAARLLKEKGLFLNHGITTDFTDSGRSVGQKFVNTFVFPDGELTNISEVSRQMEKAGFEILDIESLRTHYAKTLERWVHSLEKNEEKARALVPEKTYRIWRLYMAGSSYGFAHGSLNVYQVLASKHSEPGLPRVPLTRADLYQV
ncbi:hypothetical protein A3D23_03535 [candidate division WOR-1 bacterium RIFCSPHIGHO2_02_FULL_53_26]|nr:MAG: hypothetical protein A3D23_03535 [candidate division WOR-1 bacterium RIFCSPHIGHO2_02_FULL_53_26]